MNGGSRRGSVRLDWTLTVRDDPGLTSSAKLVGLVMATFMGADGVCWPSIATLVRGTSLGERTVERRRDELLARGYLVVVEPGGGRTNSNRYRAAVEDDDSLARWHLAAIEEVAFAPVLAAVSGSGRAWRSSAHLLTMPPCVVESIALAAASDLQVAIVGAGAAIFGGLVGGAVTGWVTLKAEDKRQTFTRSLETERLKQEAERERAIVRGAARVWRTRLREAKALYEAQVERGVWMDQLFPVTDQPPIEDRKLIASALSASEWRELERAEIALAVMESLHRTVLTAKPIDLSFSASHKSTVPMGIERFNAGMDALSAAAELEAIQMERRPL